MNVIDQLDTEWETLSRSRTMAAALDRWAAEEPALRHRDVLALVAAVERRDADPADTDRILAALARRATDDVRAARLLLQLVLPGCKALLRRYHVGSRDERVALVVSAAWDRIRTYPIERRPAKIAANVVGDVRQRLLQSVPPAPVASLDAVPEWKLPSVPGGPEAGVEVVALLGRAVRQGVVDEEEARLVALTRLAGVEVAELSEAQGTSQQTLRRRRLRAEARLRTLVTA